VVAAAGWFDWPEATAHVGVLTAAGARGRGLAARVAAAVTGAALEQGLLPQWRARVVPSQRVARRLGYRVLGRQFSVRPG
jgi:RimJ/RimL family protein N-acetyltransferase